MMAVKMRKSRQGDASASRQKQQELWRPFFGKGKSNQEKELRVSTILKEGTT
jgi:hypothetical protein